MDTGKTIDRRDARRTLALVLAGGRGSRLRDLTNVRAKPAVHFGGKFRIIDFVLSNCLNSGIRRVSVLTQYKSHSLVQHIQRGWGYLRGEFGEFIEIIPAQQQLGQLWYRGTADAVYQNLDIIRNSTPPDYIVVLAGDHVYKMDYERMLQQHRETLGQPRRPGGLLAQLRRTGHALLVADHADGVVDLLALGQIDVGRHDDRRDQ